MADAAAARREARRKRILENSQNRLQLISGAKTIDECPKVSPSKVSSPIENVDDTSSNVTITHLYQSDSNGSLFSGPDTFSLLSEVQDSVAAGDTEMTVTGAMNDFTNLFSSRASNEKVSSTWEKIMNYKYDVILLVVIKQLLYYSFSYESAYFFLPLAIYTSTRLVWFPTDQKSKIANFFLLMNGMSANKAQVLTTLLQFFMEVTVDISVYLFVTICIQSLLATLISTVLT